MNYEKVVKVKLVANNEVRCLGDISSFEELNEGIKNVLGERVSTAYKLSYKDSEGVEITLDTSYEFNKLKQGTDKSLTFVLRPKKKDTYNGAIINTTKMEGAYSSIEPPEETKEVSKKEQYHVIYPKYEDGLSYRISPRERKEISLRIFNNGATSFPEDTVLLSFESHIAKNVHVGPLESNTEATIKIELTGPLIPKTYVVNFQLSAKVCGCFGEIVAINIEVNPMPLLHDLKSKDIRQQLSQYKAKLAIKGNKALEPMEENISKLMNIFINYDPQIIIKGLEKANNDFMEALHQLYMINL